MSHCTPVKSTPGYAGEEHPRLHRFFLGACPPRFDGEGDTVAVVFFDRDDRLRSHALKHLGNQLEFEVWRKYCARSSAELLAAIGSIRDLGCPFFTQGRETPPCAVCRLYAQCSDVAQVLEQAYLGLLELVVDAGATLPRFARFASEKSEFIWLLAEPGVIVKMIWEKDRFRVMTAHIPDSGRTLFQEVREKVLRNIQMERIGRVQWCTEETWRLSASGHHRSSGKGAGGSPDERRKGREKRKEPRKRHVRGKNWRSVLADQDE